MKWMSGKDAAEYAGYSRDWVEHRAIPWEASPVPYRIRYKLVKGSPTSEPVRRYWQPDIDALFVVPGDSGPRTLGPKFN